MYAMFSDPNPSRTNLVFSKHALERMEQRIISEDMVRRTVMRPDRHYVEDDGDTKFIRTVNGVRLHVVCKPLYDQDKWLVKSTWVRGEDDNGNRVDRYGRYLGKARRYTLPRGPQLSERRPIRPLPPKPAASGMWLNLLLLLLLLALVGGLVYLLAR
jgi:hypothetical protein